MFLQNIGKCCDTTQTHNSVRPTKPTVCIFSIVVWKYW